MSPVVLGRELIRAKAFIGAGGAVLEASSGQFRTNVGLDNTGARKWAPSVGAAVG
jgi:hypothetical protein